MVEILIVVTFILGMLSWVVLAIRGIKTIFFKKKEKIYSNSLETKIH